MIHSRIHGLIRLIRPELPLAAGLCVVLGQLLAAGGLPPTSGLILGFASIFCLAATALILNDYFDYDIDKVNAPERPLPSGLVSRRDALMLSVATALLGLALSAWIGGAALLLACAVWVVGVAYNWRFKRSGLPGNLMVAFCVGSTFVYGGIVAGHPTDGLVWWFGILVALFDLGEEIAADAMDAEGDRLIGSRSLAILIGPGKALLVSAAVFFAVILFGAVPFILQWLPAPYLVPMLLLDTVIVLSVGRLLKPGHTNHRKIIRMNYLGGAFCIVFFIVLRLALR
jgi:geranylgeranylglycerol-phosphate geranylgeranyltransferase